MTSDAPHITLLGRTSAWQLHQPVAVPRKGGYSRHRSIDTPLFVTWLHHRTYGTLGVYATDKSELRDIERRRKEWVKVTGVFRPCRVVALPDDPRSATSRDDAPLLLAVVAVQQAKTLPVIGKQPLLTATLPIRITPGQPAKSGRIAPVVGWADAVYWQEAHNPPAIFATWNTVHGVVTPLGPHRYLRYVLSYTSTFGTSGGHRV